MMKVNV